MTPIFIKRHEQDFFFSLKGIFRIHKIYSSRIHFQGLYEDQQLCFDNNKQKESSFEMLVNKLKPVKIANDMIDLNGNPKGETPSWVLFTPPSGQAELINIELLNYITMEGADQMKFYFHERYATHIYDYDMDYTQAKIDLKMWRKVLNITEI